jgi:hypothetical protein
MRRRFDAIFRNFCTALLILDDTESNHTALRAYSQTSTAQPTLHDCKALLLLTRYFGCRCKPLTTDPGPTFKLKLPLKIFVWLAVLSTIVPTRFPSV